MTPFELRPAQSDCLKAIKDQFDAGVQRQVICLPTGDGKTVVFSHIPQVNPGKTLVIEHTEELIKQAYKKLHLFNPDLKIGIEKAENYAEPDSDVVITSVQTFGKKDPKRRERYYGFDNIIPDECHHAVAQGYVNIFEHYGFPCDGSLTAPPGKLLIGATATLKRSDNRGLDHIFQEVVYSRSLRDSIEDGYLVDFLPYRIATTTSLDGVGLRGDDYKPDELANRINNDERNHLIVNGFLQHAFGKKALLFCANVRHTAALTELFCQAGIKAEMIVGSTPADVRRAILWRYANGITTMLLGCQVFTEGFDDPTIQVIGLTSPTRSQIAFIQKIGRVARPDADLTGIHTAWQRREVIANSRKPYGIILDFVDNFSKNSPIMLPTLLGLNENIKLGDKPIFKAVKEIEDAVRESPGLKADNVTDIEKLQELKTHAVKVNIWENEVPKEVKNLSSLAWQKSEDREYWISLNKHETLQLKENTLGHWEASLEKTAIYSEAAQAWIPSEKKKEILGHEANLEDIFRRSDKYIAKYYKDKLQALDQKPNRRKELATQPQIGRLRQLGIEVVTKGGKSFQVRETRLPNGTTRKTEVLLTKGYAGVLISGAFRKKAA